ncbi:MAG: endopeptidase La [Clostridia bacterium]|nr:endopeptidase La [Clostridia bacterium]
MTNFNSMPMLILRGMVVFPGMLLHFDVGRKKSIAAINKAMDSNQTIFLATQKDISVEDPKVNEVYKIGCVAVIKQILKTSNDTIRVMVEGVCRATVDCVLDSVPCFHVTINECIEKYSKASELKKEALLRNAREAFEEYVSLSPRIPPDVLGRVLLDNDMGHLADYIASNLPLQYQDKQTVLNNLSPAIRLQDLIVILRKESDILRYENEINGIVQRNIDDNQREYYMREQLKVLNEELGNTPDVDDELAEYRKKIAALNATESVKKKLEKEVAKIERMPHGSHEETVVRGYLDTCLELPWGVYSKDNINIDKSRKILERDHYGMTDVKKRIIELLAVKKLAPEINGQIICLVGAPGVGKTSVARSIAKCMGRKFARISLGGVKDESEIRGHRRTYIGSMPGRIINAFLETGVSNPLILLDEIDKIGSDHKGDCSAALLEALDPEQNVSFRDHFIDMPYDLSKAIFITTANDEGAISGPLRDRMEIIELPSYTREDKFRIAKKYLVPKEIKKHGLDSKNCKITNDALYEVIDYYTREAGVRKLEQNIAALCRMAAVDIADGKTEGVKIYADNVSRQLGVRKYRPESVYECFDEVGTVNGLAWTSVGGELMKLEASALDGTGKIVLTGSLGDVMKESAQTAVSYVRSIANVYGIDTKFYKNKDIHLHATEAAVPKDGPSAGITMAVALVSALSGIAIRHDVAMTGEISLLGKVLPIGGLKEKTMAAYRAGTKMVIVPEGNKADLSEVDERVKENIEFVIVNDMKQVLDTALVANKSGTKSKQPSVTKKSTKSITNNKNVWESK